MYFRIKEKVIVENNSFEMDKEDVRNIFENITLGGIWTSPTAFTEAVRDELASMHAVQCSLKIIFALYFNAIAKESFLAFSLGSTGMANHLSYLWSLEQLLKKQAIRRPFELGLKLIKKKIKELSGVLLNAWHDLWYKGLKEIFGHII